MGDGKATDAMVESLFNLTQYLKSEYGIKSFGGHQEVLPTRFCPGNIGMEWVEKIGQTLKMQKPGQKKIKMKNVSYLLNITVIFLIFLTPKNFHNDYTLSFDWLIIFSIVFNAIIFYINKEQNIKVYLVISLVQVFYCLFAVSANDEIEFKSLRILQLFSNDIRVNNDLLVFCEYLWFVSVMLVIISQGWLIVSAIKRKFTRI